jgi:uncharacterized protein YndB with AHSA1/START domain
MLKWIGGCLIVVLILIAGGSYFAMRTMRQSLSSDGSARVAIHAPLARVFASLGSADSAATYMAAGNRITTNRRGLYQPGDSIRVELRATLGMNPAPMIWIVKEVVPDQRIVLEMNTVGKRPVTATRVDSVFAKGDSTIIVSRLATLPDSVRSSATADVMMTMFQMQSKLELESLKIRIEGRPAPKRKP